MIQLNGADNVTINGLNTGGNSLTIENTSTASNASTIYFANDASSNIITNCVIKGSGTANCVSTFSGIIFLVRIVQLYNRVMIITL
jgi:hypothetical protein